MIYRVKEPFFFTIFGASGDLAKLKIFPALYSLAEQKRLPKDYYIVGFARTPKERKQFQKEFSDSVKNKLGKDLNKKILHDLVDHVYYFTGKYDKCESYKELKDFLLKTSGGQMHTHIAYFSVPPTVFKPIIKNLGECRRKKTDDIRLVIEKPFGDDSCSAEELYHFISNYFSEDQVYLLDHFLGKSGVQSILHLRQTNRILNLLLKGYEISNIQITAFEDIGIKDRVGYFEEVGIIKDMIQSHLLQILAYTTMSIPLTSKAESLHREKYAILSAINVPKKPENVVLGQYKGYKKEKGVPANSKTDTFAAIKLYIDQEQWYKVPIYLRTGKKLSAKKTNVIVEFKKFPFQNNEEEPNLLKIELSPEENIIIQLVNKYRSGASQYETIATSKSIACSGDYCLPEHGLLLLDVLRKNKCSFLSFREILASWRVTEEILNLISKNKIKVHKYDDGSDGPSLQNTLVQGDGFNWHK